MVEINLAGRRLTVTQITEPLYQYNNIADTVRVTGDIPDGGSWALLIAIGGCLDIIPMSAGGDALTCTLTAAQLSMQGYYTLQLRHSEGDTVWHSTPVLLQIGKSLSGDEQWPEIPTEFTEALERAEAAKTAAETAKSGAEQSAAAAAAAEAEAQAAQAAAETARDTASGSAATAGEKAAAAAGSATAANTAKEAAETARTAAQTAATTATTQATAAATSATNASTSATAAAGSASAAQTAQAAAEAAQEAAEEAAERAEALDLPLSVVDGKLCITYTEEDE